MAIERGKSGEAPRATPAMPGDPTTPAEPAKGRGKSEDKQDDTVDDGAVSDGTDGNA